MCVKIFNSGNEVSYDADQPLEAQIGDSSKVVINYDPQDPSIGKFLSEIERCTQNGVSLDLNLQVIHNNHLGGAKTKRLASKLSQDLCINDVIKAMATSYAETDKKLEELANCLSRNE